MKAKDIINPSSLSPIYFRFEFKGTTLSYKDKVYIFV
jgi:hypothetical protein